MSSVANAMAAQGYVPASQRAACANCLHGAENTDALMPRWWCQRGGFRVTAMAVCVQHAPRGAQDGALAEAAE